MVSTERKAAATIARSGAYLPQLDGLRALAILAVNSGRTEWREEAKAHIGETAAVRGLVEQVSFSRKRHAFLNFGGRYPKQSFTGFVRAQNVAAVGGEEARGASSRMCPSPGRLSAALLEWKGIQETFKGRRIRAPGGIAFAASEFVFAGYSGEPFSNRAFNLRLRAACGALGVGEITAHGLRHSAATILLNHVGKDLREIQELLRHKNIRTTVRYTHVGYEQTRQTAEALSRALE